MIEPPTIAAAEPVYGDGPGLDDPAETYHEASRLAAATALARLPGLALLESDPAVAASVRRSSRLHSHRSATRLPPARLPEAPLGEVLAARRSGLAAAAGALTRAELGTVLACAYGVDDGRRRVPSAGALYPLELYVAVRAGGQIRRGLHHYDPFAHRLERLSTADPDGPLAEALVEPALLECAAAVLLLTAVFWRTRFKYGQRGYRFALLEAGHVAQNALLAAASLGLPALPVGGFYDRAADAVAGVDGLDESTLYLLLLGGRT